MQKYVALLRGINVSGANRVLMPDLARLLEELGLERVRTYLASGNAIFDAPDTDFDRLAALIEAQIARQLGLDLRVLVRDAAYFADVLAGNPFLDERSRDVARLYVTFLQHPAPADRLVALVAPPGETAAFTACGDVIYLFCPDGYGRTKLSNAFFERKLGVAATTRNWNTVTALAGMTRGDEID